MVLGRRYLCQFLETVASQGLVGYYTTVEELKSAQRKNWHQIGAEIFYTYIRNPTGEIKVDKSTKKRMEAFLLGELNISFVFFYFLIFFKIWISKTLNI